MKKVNGGKRIRKHHFRQSSTKVTNLSHLPEEILLDIIQYLYLPKLETLSLVCRRLRDVCAESLYNGQEIARNKFKELRLDSQLYEYHEFLIGILKHEINPNYVKRFDCGGADERTPFDSEDEAIHVALFIGWTPRDIQLVKTAISYSPWLKDIVSPDELIASMLNGNEDSVLALLVPMLKNLCFFVPPANSHTLMQVFVKIARLQVVAEIEDPGLWQCLPLRKLHTIFGIPMFRYPTWIDLPQLIHFISLPSVRRVYIADGSAVFHTQDEIAILRTAESKGIPRSRASIVFINSSCTYRDTAELFADRFTGPCVIRQNMQEAIPTELGTRENWRQIDELEVDNVRNAKDPIFYYWDHCTISSGKDPVTKEWRKELRSIEFELKYRNFHFEVDNEIDIVRYEEDMQQAGVPPSPEWMTLVKWHHGLTDPELDADTLVL